MGRPWPRPRERLPDEAVRAGTRPPTAPPPNLPGLEKIDYKEMQIISKTVAAVAWELATEPGRPKLNAKLPDDLKKDMETVAIRARDTPEV